MADTQKVLFDGTHRTRSIEQTLAAVQPFLTRAGITRVADVSALDPARIPVVMVARPNSRSLSVAQGKGLSLAAAKVSGIMEAVEHFHAENIAHPLRLASLEEMTGRDDLCALSDLPRTAAPPPAPNFRFLWIEGLDLVSQRTKWVPFEMVHLDLSIPLPPRAGCFPISSNGLASGNTLEEATVHALSELIERDAWTLFRERSAEARDTRRMDLATLRHTPVAEMLAAFTEHGISAALWDLTNDLATPCVLAALLEREDSPYRRVPLAYGCGCHCDAEVALARALTEAAQGRTTNIVGARDDTTPSEQSAGRDEVRQRQTREELQREKGERSFDALPSSRYLTHDEELNELLSRLDAVGLREAIRVDLSRDDWPVSVVRMIVPGLESHHEIPDLRLGRRAAFDRTLP